jgi:hypothetical protein
MSERTSLLVAVLAGAVVLTLAATDGSGSGLLCLLPAIALAAPLIARRSPGEQVLLALGAGFTSLGLWLLSAVNT